MMLYTNNQAAKCFLQSSISWANRTQIGCHFIRKKLLLKEL